MAKRRNADGAKVIAIKTSGALTGGWSCDLPANRSRTDSGTLRVTLNTAHSVKSWRPNTRQEACLRRNWSANR